MKKRSCFSITNYYLILMSSLLSAFEFVARQCQDLHVRANINVSTAGFIRKLKLRTTCAFMCHASVNAIGDSQEYPPPPTPPPKKKKPKPKTNKRRRREKYKEVKREEKRETGEGTPSPLYHPPPKKRRK